MTYKGYLSGLRWAGIMEFLFEASTVAGLELKIIQDDKGIVRRTIYFQVEGSEITINAFVDACKKAVGQYNDNDVEFGKGKPEMKPKDQLKHDKEFEENLKGLEEISKKYERKETGSEFGKGFVYCLVMLAAHFNNHMGDLIGHLAFLMKQTDEDLEKIFNKSDPKHIYGKEMDTAIFYMQHMLHQIHHGDKARMLSQEIELWANGASDHLYEIQVPKKFEGTEIEKKTLMLREMGLQMGHGFLHNRVWTIKDLEDLKKLTSDIIKLVDKDLGVEVIDAQWGEL